MQSPYTIAAIATTAALAGWVLYRINSQRRTAAATAFLTVLQRHLALGSGELQAAQALDPSYVLQIAQQLPKTARLVQLKPHVAQGLAKAIHSAWGFWNDNETKIYSVFRSLADKVAVAQVAKAYARLYGISLLDHLQERLSKSERQNVLRIIANKPNYRSL